MMMMKRSLLGAFVSGIALHVSAAPLVDLDFTAAEGFSDGADLNGIQGFAAQSGWDSGDTGGTGYATCVSSWNRAKKYASFTRNVGQAVVIESTLRLADTGGAAAAKDIFKIGFAEASLHSGQTIPSIYSVIHTDPSGSYWFGRENPNSRIYISAADAGDWIKFTQVIERGSNSGEFYGYVSASNVTDGVDLGGAFSTWMQADSDGSWGGTMQPSFSALDVAQKTVQLDRWTVSLIDSFDPPSASPILIDPEVSVAVDGELYLDRTQFFSLSDAGRKFESTVANSALVDYYVDNLGMKFGRELGGAYGVVGWNSSAIREDSSRPGYVDVAYLASKLNPDNGGSSASFISKFSPNLDVAMHDRQTDSVKCFPSFMPTWSATGDTDSYPVNADAYGEWIAGVLEHNYTDWTRPATYEIINEPSWLVTGDQRFADLHTQVKAHVNASGLNVAVGGPCSSVGYYYKNAYQSFGMKDFIDNTGCGLDFYSFHVYDYMRWDTNTTDFVGRVSTGLPVEGVLDMVQSYTRNTYGKGVEMVLSEHGGYISTEQETALDTVANLYFPSNSFPGTGFEWEMKRRSVSEFVAVRSAIANTMAFMNNPHVVRKAVPFILLQSANWDPRYYSTLLVKENFNPSSSVWHESTYVNFYKFFKNVEGRRVRVQLDDPDIQCQAYVNGAKLHILLNNLADAAAPLSLVVPTSGMQAISLRRFGRNIDFTPYFTESAIGSLDGLQIEGRESIALEISYSGEPAEKLRLDEVPYYADVQQQAFSGSRTFNLVVPEYQSARRATLRIGLGRSSGLDPHLLVSFNGTALRVPFEDCAERLDNGTEYGSIKLIHVPLDLLQSNNTVEVAFPDNGYGGIGAVVLRAEIDRPVPGAVYAVNCAGSQHIAGDGTVYQADNPAYYTTSSTGTDSISDFGGTTEDALYKNERYAANFSYSIPVENGDYEVTLHMAENWFNTSGSRIFNVAVEGVNVISGLDIYAVAGRANAYDQTFSASVSDGLLDISFSRTVNNAKINAIKAVKQVPPQSSAVYSEWANRFNLPGNESALGLDPDGDGLDNETEFICGTDPLDGRGLPACSGSVGADDFSVSFTSVPDRLYTVETTENLQSGWSDFTNGIPGTGGIISVDDPLLISNRFYRIKVQVE